MRDVGLWLSFMIEVEAGKGSLSAQKMRVAALDGHTSIMPLYTSNT